MLQGYSKTLIQNDEDTRLFYGIATKQALTVKGLADTSVIKKPNAIESAFLPQTNPKPAAKKSLNDS